MFNDFRNTSREGWKYAYLGKDLLAAAQAKLQELYQQEAEARAAVSRLTADMQVHHEDKRILAAKQEIESAGNQREQCEVFVHEFARNPDREYNLSLGDVVYFKLAPKYDGQTKKSGYNV
jgi:hypothetical protein